MASTLRGPIRRSPYVQQWVPFIILVLGCVLTATAVTMIATRQEVATANAFRADTLAVQRVTQVQLDTVVAVTHELPSIFAIGNNSIFLDAETKTAIAGGDPAESRLELAHPHLVAPVGTLLVVAGGVEEADLSAGVADVGLGERRDERAEGTRLPGRVGVAERHDLT